MQQAMYPLVPVICNNSDFADLYNADMMSSLYQSSCMELDEVEKLMSEGAKFDQVVIINDDNSALINKFSFAGKLNNEYMPEIVHLQIDEAAVTAVNEVHRAIQNVIYNRGTG